MVRDSIRVVLQGYVNVVCEYGAGSVEAEEYAGYYRDDAELTWLFGCCNALWEACFWEDAECLEGSGDY